MADNESIRVRNGQATESFGLGGGSRRGAKEARGERCGKGAYLRETGRERKKGRERGEKKGNKLIKVGIGQEEAVMVW
jgi:hypothetical protein